LTITKRPLSRKAYIFVKRNKDFFISKNKTFQKENVLFFTVPKKGLKNGKDRMLKGRKSFRKKLIFIDLEILNFKMTACSSQFFEMIFLKL
jgi:hypothetical protein